jgi:hypothetical protein
MIAGAATLGACAGAGKSAPGPGDNEGSDAGTIVLASPDTATGDGPMVINSDCPAGLESITVTPASTPLTLAYSATPSPVTTTLTATGKFQNGSTSDITGCAVWTVSPSGPTVAGGAFSTTTAGYFTVTVEAVSSTGSSTVIQGSATVIVTLTGTANSGGVSTTGLSGTPSGTPLSVAYPLDGALFPLHFGDLGFQVVPSSSSFTTASISFQGDAANFVLYAACTPIQGATMGNACTVSIPASLEADLAGMSAGSSLTETVRISDGTNVAESMPMSVRWAASPLAGTIYYWSAPPRGGGGSSGASEIIRLNLGTPGTPPEVFLTNEDIVPYAPPLSGGWACIGCHAISQDGSKLALTIGGSSIAANGDGNGSFFALLDVNDKVPIAAQIVDSSGQFLQGGFAELTTFSPNAGDTMVQELQGQLYVRASAAALTSTGPLFPWMWESMTEPNWSYKGDLLTFASWVPDLAISHTYDSKDENGNEIPNAQIWKASSNGTTFGTPSILVPRVTGATEYYPAISDDSAFVVFDESSCSGPPTSSNDGYGASPCDSYDDPSAHLRLVSSTGGAPVDLDNASQRTSGWPTSSTWTNSWPRFAPPAGSASQKSTFQGKTLYWIAFSSRLPYGATLQGSQDGSTPPQIWFAAIAVDPSGGLSSDPSFAPVWLPLQNSATPEILLDGGVSQTLGGDGAPTGNHIPQWVYTYVPYKPPPPKDGGYLPPPP